ncbi:hypothetical protein HMPREF0493_0856 [Lactobacillus amylolyticus DSM 11664]|uniref:Uncharacterized protein n=1 Tax=Lactobacillus amylolyticus DSM 11664 TaxID=585524 RepID=D4YTJ5_9LACO|nr:hypothetical protein HMPREF0493_0856 [Lactobacillus amylolyticus DSM 11664]
MLVLMLLHTLTVLLQTSSMILQLLQVGKTSLEIYFELDELIDRLKKTSVVGKSYVTDYLFSVKHL